MKFTESHHKYKRVKETYVVDVTITTIDDLHKYRASSEYGYDFRNHYPMVVDGFMRVSGPCSDSSSDGTFIPVDKVVSVDVKHTIEEELFDEKRPVYFREE